MPFAIPTRYRPHTDAIPKGQSTANPPSMTEKLMPGRDRTAKPSLFNWFFLPILPGAPQIRAALPRQPFGLLAPPARNRAVVA